MATETLEQPVVKKEKSEGLLSKRRRKFVTDPLNDDNPDLLFKYWVICSALAITLKMEPTLVMSIAVLFVIVFSNLIISVFRNLIPNRVRIIVQTGGYCFPGKHWSMKY